MFHHLEEMINIYHLFTSVKLDSGFLFAYNHDVISGLQAAILKVISLKINRLLSTYIQR